MSKLQLNQKTLIKKQLSKLSLEIKFSQINSTWYEQTQSKTYKSPNSASPAYIRSFQSTTSQMQEQQIGQPENERLQMLQRQLEKQIIFIQMNKKALRQKMAEFQKNQLKRQNQMEKTTTKRRILIQNLKRQVHLVLRHNVEQKQLFFTKLQMDFNNNLEIIQKKLRKMKKQWRAQLRKIVQKMQQQKYKNTKQTMSPESVDKQQAQFCLKHLQAEVKSLAVQQKKKSQSLQLLLSALLQQFSEQQTKYRQKFTENCLSLFQSMHRLQRSLRSQVQKQHFASQQNRQKILLLFQQNVQKIQKQRQIRKLSHKNRYKPAHLQYRHQQYRHQQYRNLI